MGCVVAICKPCTPFFVYKGETAMIIKGSFLESIDANTIDYFEGFLRLDDAGTIQERGTEVHARPGEEVHDYTGKLILQGFCDMHLHAPQYPMRALGLNLTLLDWLKEHTFPAEKAFGEEGYARRVSENLAKELVQNGTTRVAMFASLHTDSTLVLMEVLEKAGICGYVGKVNMDRNGCTQYEETSEESKRETLRFLEKSERFENIRPIVTPRFTPCCTDELMAFLGELVQSRNLPIQSHISENANEIAWVLELCPSCKSYFETYERWGLWNERTIMAHCVHSDEKEQEAMRKAGVYAAHCPSSNVNLMSGCAPVHEMLNKGLHVVLGSDIAGGDELSMLRVMRSAIQTSKIRTIYEDIPPIDAKAAYYMSTTAAQPYFGGGVGFAAGDKLHAVVVDDSRHIGTFTPTERLEQAVYLAEKSDICAVYANGKKLATL